jgi:hypothetical protein
VQRPRWIRKCEIEDDDLRRGLDEVLRRIPVEDARDFPDVEILEVDVTAEGANVSGGERWTIRLSPRQLNRRVGSDAAALRGLLAHELAHAFLRHAEGDESRSGTLEEEEADRKAREWVGTEVDAFRRRFGPPYPEVAPEPET